ncbi:MAG: xanthine dehydrogenase accessory protein XdhC [Gammaproteobacteria bacterium]|nr:xanthine dehydrogenase accessory protein XdhC [Gammaproteobacteria bacterium]
MIKWLQQLQAMLESTDKVVIVSVASVKGSTPREPGARMLVSENKVNNTIGGGHLEYKAIQLARNMLSQDVSSDMQRFSLGASLGQCCGGIVTVFFEVVSNKSEWVKNASQLMLLQQNFIQVIPVKNSTQLPRFIVSENSVHFDCSDAIDKDVKPLVKLARTMLANSEVTSVKRVGNNDYVFDPVSGPDFNIYLFGAGHVGEAVIKYLEDLPCRVNWVDTRDGQLPDITPANVIAINTDIPQSVIDEAPAGSYFLVMTHDHSLDQDLAESILRRDDYCYFGLIGSLTKRKKFEHRLSQRGINVAQLSRMSCPVGINGIHSKQPAAIALAITAELVQCYEKMQRGLQLYCMQTNKENIKL